MLILNHQNLDYKDVYRVAVEREAVSLGDDARRKVSTAADSLRLCISEGRVIYGVNTGFGALKDMIIADKDIELLQKKLVMSHAVAVGKPFDEEVVRGMILIIANYLSKAHSGVRPIVIDTLLAMLNENVCPVVPEKGSVGSSGDLAPAAHIALVLCGEGEAIYKGRTYIGGDALTKAGITPLSLQAKEGLALINNTSCMTSLGALCMVKADMLLMTATVAGSLSTEALRASREAFDPDIHAMKPYPAQIEVANHLLGLLENSTMVDDSRIQDQYSIRCMPQIHGGIGEALRYVAGIVNTEINSVTDNPLIFEDEQGRVKTVSGGNFHGEALAIAMDTLGIAVSELANVSDRRIASLLDMNTSNGLPAFLAEHEGLNSGMMVLQYTTASLVSENKVLSHPSSVDSIPTSANTEDLVSMGTIGARKAREIIGNVTIVLANELMVACQAIDIRLNDTMTLGAGTGKAYALVRAIVPYFPEDTVYYPYSNRLSELVDSGKLAAIC